MLAKKDLRRAPTTPGDVDVPPPLDDSLHILLGPAQLQRLADPLEARIDQLGQRGDRGVEGPQDRSRDAEAVRLAPLEVREVARDGLFEGEAVNVVHEESVGYTKYVKIARRRPCWSAPRQRASTARTPDRLTASDPESPPRVYTLPRRLRHPSLPFRTFRDPFAVRRHSRGERRTCFGGGGVAENGRRREGQAKKGISISCPVALLSRLKLDNSTPFPVGESRATPRACRRGGRGRFRERGRECGGRLTWFCSNPTWP